MTNTTQLIDAFKSLRAQLSRGRKPITIVSYGAGVDSTAVLVGMWRRGERPDHILFANVGSEKPETYHFLFGVLGPWLAEIGFPQVTIVQKVVKTFVNTPYSTLAGNCVSNSTLPSLAMGGKGCSQKWKAEPLDAFVNELPEVKEAIARGEKIIRVIGYDAGPKDARRGQYETQDPNMEWSFPLRVWGWDRERCVREIAAAGLPVPMKSACWFCPGNKPSEIKWLMENHPELARGIVEIERKAAVVQAVHPKAKGVKGLWGKGVKGLRRGAEKKPGRMSDYLAELGFEPALRVDFAAIEATAKGMFHWTEMPKRAEKRIFVDAVLAQHADELFDRSSILDSEEPEVDGSILATLADERAAA